MVGIFPSQASSVFTHETTLENVNDYFVGVCFSMRLLHRRSWHRCADIKVNTHYIYNYSKGYIRVVPYVV